MFNKKCTSCGEELENDFRFCPYCGASLKKEEDRRNYGLLGRDDDIDFRDFRLPFGFNGIFKKLVKELNKQIKNSNSGFGQDNNMNFKKGIRINISSSGEEPKIRVNEIGNKKKNKKKSAVIKNRTISPEKMKKFRELPKLEPETNVRRLSNKLVYEIDLPGVNSLKDVLINRLENSIEIKALSKKKAFSKIIPVNLPLVRYNLEKGKLILELKPKN